MLPRGRWPHPRRDGRLVVPGPTPMRWLPIVQGITSHRDQMRQRFSEVDAAWREILCAAEEHSRAGISQIAEAAGIGRQRLHQIRAEHAASREPEAARRSAAAAASHQSRVR